MPAHKHYELMRLYLEDAAETETPWEKWEVRNPQLKDERWEPLAHNPLWDSDYEYRCKPRTININGHEVPEPVRGPLKIGDKYYLPKVYSRRAGFHADQWDGSRIDQSILDGGLIHLTREAAIAHAKALLSFTAKEVAK